MNVSTLRVGRHSRTPQPQHESNMLLNDYSIIHSIVSKDYELLRSALAMGADDALILVALEISRTLCDPAEISEFILHQVKHECFVKFIESKDHCVDLLRAIVRGDNKAFGKVVVDPAMMQV